MMENRSPNNTMFENSILAFSVGSLQTLGTYRNLGIDLSGFTYTGQGECIECEI